MVGNKFLTTLLFIFCLLYDIKAQNLVPNASFENHTDCPKFSDELEYCNDWQGIGSPDYYNSCAEKYKKIPDFYCLSVPLNWAGFQEPKDGNAYVGIYLMSFLRHSLKFYGHREYIQTKLTSPLEKSKLYEFSMYISRSDSNTHFSKYISFSLSKKKPYPMTKLNEIISQKDRIKLKIEEPKNNTSWQKLTYLYTAKGGEQFLTIGSFLEDFSKLKYLLMGVTNFDSLKRIRNSERTSYYLIDHVSLVEYGEKIEENNFTKP